MILYSESDVLVLCLHQNIVNEHISKEFEIGRAFRQGDPLSPYLFVLCAEIIAIMMINRNISGIIDDVGFKLT